MSDILKILQSENARVHLVGIGGVGMAGLAATLKLRGVAVSGCDEAQNPLMPWLSGLGIDVQQGHDPLHAIAPVDAVIRSTAVPPDGEELKAFAAGGVPIWRRGDVLPCLLAGRTSVAVTGTHGKTTTSGLIAQVLQHAGCRPAWCIGGVVSALGAVAGGVAGEEGVFVVEADESDGTAAGYTPDIAVVMNIEFDHMEHFEDEQSFRDCFATFMAGARQALVYNGDDETASALAENYAHAVSFGFSPGVRYRAVGMDLKPDSSSFVLVRDEAEAGRVFLPFPGKHNITNALAALAVCDQLHQSLETAITALGRSELPARRLECVAEGEGIRVISDYAHHPSEVSATLSVMRQMPCRRLRVLFQPHRFTRTLALGGDFPAAFEGVDELILLPVYAASEAPLEGGGEWDLHDRFVACRKSNSAVPRPMLVSSLDEAWQYLRRTWRDGDLIGVLGAGDVEWIASKAELEIAGGPHAERERLDEALSRLLLSDQSRMNQDVPMAPMTSLGVGGVADACVELGNVTDFRAVLQWAAQYNVPFTLIGGGSNLLVSDLGIRGMVARLRGSDFSEIRREGDLVVVGAAVTLADFLDWLEERSLAGMEFIQGIPGTMGGGMHMNAGAWRKSLGDYVEWIRCLDRLGNVHTVPRDELQLGYRKCGYLQERFVIEAAFSVKPGDPAAIRREREEIRQKRAWMVGYRSAGSAFKNPVDDHAGRLLEKAGMRGTGIGGARVFEGHGNFITADGDVTASDVRALISRGRVAVASKFGVALETEVRILW